MDIEFHDVRFPTDIALHAKGGPERKTSIVTMGSGAESRNAKWKHARRKYNAGYGIKSLSALSRVLEFFEARRGMLYGFRWRDRADFKSCAPENSPSALDQYIGTGDGQTRQFQLIKTYEAEGPNPYQRPITKPVRESVLLAMEGRTLQEGLAFDVEYTTGLLTFRDQYIPTPHAKITAGFFFDVPVRFDTDYLETDLTAFNGGIIPHIPLIEIT